MWMGNDEFHGVAFSGVASHEVMWRQACPHESLNYVKPKFLKDETFAKLLIFKNLENYCMHSNLNISQLYFHKSVIAPQNFYPLKISCYTVPDDPISISCHGMAFAQAGQF